MPRKNRILFSKQQKRHKASDRTIMAINIFAYLIC